MTIPNFDGNTFVAFTDISGFKEMMKQEGTAIRALSRLNQVGYNILRDNNNVHGLFISDCGVLFVSNNNITINDKLQNLLDVIEQINRYLLNDDIMLTTSIAYGDFKYHQRIEFEGIEKHPIYGHAYVNAFLDNENGKPKIQPGQCRITINNLHDTLNLHSIKRLKKINNYQYLFYWMVDEQQDIDQEEQKHK